MTGSATCYARLQLAADLAALIETPLTCEADLAAWSNQARIVRERLLAPDPSDLGPLPESLHDYLADAEIRLMDPDYAAAQHRIIGRLIARLRRESEPARVAFG